MRAVHAVIGYAIVGALGLLWLWALVAWIARRRDVHRTFWVLLGIAQAALIVQAVAGTVLLIGGGRQPFLHYLYGSMFPAIVLVAGHAVARDEDNGFTPWKVFGFAAFISFGLTLRALTTGLGIG